MKVGFISLGCAKNLVDSEHMAAVLREEGISLAASPEAADMIIVNTCGFIGDAKEESVDAILQACARKQTGGCKAVVVAGCLVQRYRKQLQCAIPEVDAFVGLDELPHIGRIMRQVERGRRGIFDVSPVSRKLFSPLPSRVVFTGGPFAYVKIAEGCNHRCSFCAIPGIRGRYRSRSMDDVVRETETLLGHGMREINLISQDTFRYGHDRKDGASLPRLLKRLDGIGGSFWIRMLYGHPAWLSDELMDTIADTTRVCRYLDVPIQHANETVLRAMCRPGGSRAVHNFPVSARRRLPGVTLRTTCLVGFPGETVSQYRDLLRFIQDAQFDHLGAFAYSPEESTVAASLPRPVSPSTGRKRRDQVMAAQQVIAFERVRQKVDRTDEVLLLRKLPRGLWVARSRSQAPDVDGHIRVAGVPADVSSGSLVMVRYTGQDEYDLQARCLPRRSASDG